MSTLQELTKNMEDLGQKSNLALPPQEAELRRILNTIPGLISYVDKDLRYCFVNEAYRNWFNIPPDAVIGKTLNEVLGDDVMEKLQEPINMVLSGKPAHFRQELPYTMGNRFVEGKYVPDLDSDGSIKGFTVIISDITDTKNAERVHEHKVKSEVRRQTEERYLKMISEIQDYAISLLSKDGIILDWNNGAEKVKGYTAQEIIGHHFRIFYLKEDQDRKLPEQLIQEALENNRSSHEGWRIRKDKTRFWGSTVITALHDDVGEVIGFAKVTRDLTTKKIAEDKLLQYATQLEAQNKELEQFAYIASHDLQEPLRKIRTFNERILKNEPLTDSAKEYFNRSIAAANRMQKLIDDLLSYSRTNIGTHTFQEVNLNSVIEDIINARRESLEEKQVTLDVATLPTIFAIRFQMSQLFDNLISNAIKYSHPQRPPHITITTMVLENVDLPDLSEPGAYHKITVTDNGTGFEPQYSEKIFEIFQRLHGQNGQPGSGIGLAICRKIAKNHKGAIYAEGTLGEGASFHIYLPQ